MARRRASGAALVSSLVRCRAAAPSDEHGFDCPEGRLLRPLTDPLPPPTNLPQTPPPILEIGPQAPPQLPAGLLQTGKGVPTAPPGAAPRSDAAGSLLDLLPQVPLRAVVGPRHRGRLPHPQPLRRVPAQRVPHRLDAGEARRKP